MNRYRVRRNIVHSRVGDSVLVVNVKSKKIFELSPTASRFWELAAAGRSSEQIRARLLKEFEVSEKRLDRECRAFERSLLRNRLLEKR